MAITKLTNSGLSGDKYPNLMADNTFMEPIATTLLSSTAATITFSNIPQYYTHLQIRYISRDNRAASGDDVGIIFNGDTGSNFAGHRLMGTGSATFAQGFPSTATPGAGFQAGGNDPANTFGGGIIDILDYKNQTKYKTLRSISGYETNSAGNVGLYSALWMNTAPITSIRFNPANGTLFAVNTRFSLYGIRG